MKIAIVEDIPEVRETVCEYLQVISDVERVDDYGNAENALGGLLLNPPQVVLMDIGLPGMSGIECMVKVKRQCPQMKFIMFTVFEDDEKVFESLKAGASGYLLKREPMSKIMYSIRELLDGGAPMSKRIAYKVLSSFKDDEPKMILEQLSSRQSEVLNLIAQGLPYKMVADQLSVTIGTVKQHIHQIYKKLQVNNKTEAINKYLNRQL